MHISDDLAPVCVFSTAPWHLHVSSRALSFGKDARPLPCDLRVGRQWTSARALSSKTQNPAHKKKAGF
jgi:hypothetical protein